MYNIKTVGKSGQISLGKALAGRGFIVQEMPDGDIILKRAVVLPLNEQWLHEPAMKEKLARADDWMSSNSSAETPLNELAVKLGADT